MRLFALGWGKSDNRSEAAGAGRGACCRIRCGARDDAGCRQPGDRRKARGFPRGWPARRHGLDGHHRRAPPAPAQHVARGQIDRHAGHELRAGHRPARGPVGPQPRRHLLLCPMQGLPRCRQGRPEARGRQPGAGQRRRRQGVRRHRAADGEAAGRSGGPRLAGQAHQPGVARVRLLAVSRRHPDRGRARARRARGRSLRHLQPLPRRLPDAGVPRALPARCAPLHRLPDDRAQGPHPRRVPRADRQPRIRLRRLPRRLPLEQIRRRRARDAAGGAGRRGLAAALRAAGARRCRLPPAGLPARR